MENLLNLLEPVSTIFGLVTLGLAYAPGVPAATRYEAGCWGTLSWYRCHQQNFADIHTPAYLHALRVGHNPYPRRPRSASAMP